MPPKAVLVWLLLGLACSVDAAAETPQLDDDQPRLLVPAYFYPGGDGLGHWQRLVQAGDDVAIVAIVNPHSGPGIRKDDHYAAVISLAQAGGVQLVGYVATGYGKRPPADVRAEIDRWLRFYPTINGFFFDEQASGKQQLDYYVQLARHARARLPGAVIIANPGTRCAPEYFDCGAFDVICDWENSQPPPPRSADESVNRRRPGTAKLARRAALLHGCASADLMRRHVASLVQAGVRDLYITDDGGDNPWDRLPTYWSEEVAELKKRTAP